MTSPPQAYSAGAMRPAGGFVPLQASELPRSRFWFSDREISSEKPSPLAYTADDFRRELARVERMLYWLTIGSVAVSILAVIAIIGIIVTSG